MIHYVIDVDVVTSKKVCDMKSNLIWDLRKEIKAAAEKVWDIISIENRELTSCVEALKQTLTTKIQDNEFKNYQLLKTSDELEVSIDTLHSKKLDIVTLSIVVYIS